MRHLRVISKRPAKAQFEEALNIIGLATAILSLFRAVADTFGLTIPQKNNDDTQETED